MTSERFVPERLPTGDAGLDRLTQGGLLRHGMQVIVGVAGTGKTVLAHQIASRHIRDGGRVLYLTTILESHEMLLAQARTMRFFDASAVSHTFYYSSLYPPLERNGLAALSGELQRFVAERQPSLIIIDGLQAMRLAAKTELEFQRFMHDVESHASIGRITVVVLAHPREPADEPMLTRDDPTFTVADGVIALRTERVTLRRVRWLSVMKLRAVDHIAGWHSFTITEDGIKTYPRLEGLVAREGITPLLPSTGRCDLLVKGLGKMLGGGLPTASVTLVVGTPGAGKTLLGLAFLAAAKQGETSSYFGFHGTPDRLVAKSESVGIPLRKAVEQGRVRLHWQPPSELLADEIAERMLAVVDAAHAHRLVIDTVDDLRRGTLVGGRDLDFLSALLDLLRSRGATVLMTQDMTCLGGEPIVLPFPEVSAIVDNLIQLRQLELAGSSSIVLSIHKMRDSGFDRHLRQLQIAEKGLSIGPPVKGAKMLGTGLGRRG